MIMTKDKIVAKVITQKKTRRQLVWRPTSADGHSELLSGECLKYHHIPLPVNKDMHGYCAGWEHSLV